MITLCLSQYQSKNSKLPCHGLDQVGLGLEPRSLQYILSQWFANTGIGTLLSLIEPCVGQKQALKWEISIPVLSQNGVNHGRSSRSRC